MTRLQTSSRWLLPLALVGCQANGTDQASPTVVSADPATREALMEPLSRLAGRWTMESEEGPATIEFDVIANGSAVREVMFPGTPSEMTNMYTLDGNSVVMTHYCASGNQPHMRASAWEDGKLALLSDGVSDLTAPDEMYMGQMTLVWVDDDHVEEHWGSMSGGVPNSEHTMVMELTRER